MTGHSSSWVSGGNSWPAVRPVKDGVTGDLITLELDVPPVAGGDSNMPEYTELTDDLGTLDEDVNLDLVPTNNGVRWGLQLKWDTLGVEGRGVLAGIVNLKLQGWRFWVQPHVDSTRRVLCELVSPFDVSELFNKVFVGYGPCYLVFKSVSPIPLVFHEEVPSYWCDVDEAGYEDDELFHWGDVTEEHYTDDDRVALWTPTGAVLNAKGELVAEL